MKAMIFAAGVGSRLKELTQDTPKCMMVVGGRTMLEHVVERLKNVGVTSVAINVHHHADKITDFVASRDNFGIDILFSHEPALLNTGGGLKKVGEFFRKEETFLIHNADVFSSIDLSALIEDHREKNAIATLAVMERQSKRGLYFDSHNRLVGWSEEGVPPPPLTTLLAFCGISVASHRIFSHMPPEESFSLINPFLAAARTTGEVYGHIIRGSDWVDIGTPEQLATLQKRFSPT